MGTKMGVRSTVKNFGIRFLRNEGGSVAQLLHPNWVARDDVSLMSRVITEVESHISSQAEDVKVVVTGGGFVEIWLDHQTTFRNWKSEGGLVWLLALVEKKLLPLVEAMGDARRDYVIGVDVIIDDRGIGQFAVVFVAGEVASIVWKSYPAQDEANWVAGFGTSKGRHSPRFVRTALGKSLILVCHDAQAYNHRNQALVQRAQNPTPRMLAMDEMIRQMDEKKPLWAFNLIHYIGRPQSMKTFSTSYKQISRDHRWRPSVAGAFGYDVSVYHELDYLTEKAQYPPDSVGCAIVIEAPPIWSRH